MNSTILVFLDGVGIGEAVPEKNPFFKYPFRSFLNIFGDIPSLQKQSLEKDGKYFIFPADPLMGIKGLPQSGTGQTSIFCGINAPQLIGQHFGPYPYSTLVPEIKEKNIFRTFMDRRLRVSFVNAYPQIFFDYLNSGRQRLSVTTLSCRLSGLKLNDYNDLRDGKALSAEIDNGRWIDRLGYDLPLITPESAAERLIAIAGNNDLTVFEYFLSDHFGHLRYFETLEETLATLDRFMLHLITNIEDSQTLLVCSDHGNLEDISVKTHTLNPALTLSAGRHAAMFRERIRDLSHIKLAILDTLQ